MRKKSWIMATLVLALSHLLTYSAGFSTGRLPERAKHGMVVSTSRLASAVGVEVLKRGGNAVDAAVATAFALAVTWPAAGNIGGGGFLVYHGADGRVTAFDFREKAPLAASLRMYLDDNGRIRDNSNHDGPLAIGVPGTVAGLALAHQRLGSLPWKELLAPAIDLAEKGFPVTWGLHDGMQYLTRYRDRYPSTAKAYLNKSQEAYKPGEIFKQPDLAATLKRIARDGRDGFYKGKTASLIAAFMRKHGGLITEEDLAKYQAVERQPVHGTYRGYDVYGMCPPSSGGIAVIEMLNILEGFDLKAMGHNSALYMHIVTEAMRRAYADRARFLGDPDFNSEMPVDKLLSKAYARELRATIDLFKASPSDPARFNEPYESTETTHLSVVDAAGNMVSMTYTLEYGYGSRMVVDGAGFLLNNEMGDFNPIPGTTDSTGLIGTPPNLVAPEKRMLSSMSPTILARNGRPVMAIGSPGGRTIINTVLQVILNVIDHRMDIGQAVEAARFHHQWLPDVTRLERWGFSPDTQRLYQMMGHEVSEYEGQGRAMGVYLDTETGLRYGAADTRSPDGAALGY